MKITLVGTGYVGLVTGVSLALLGHELFCVDSNLDKVSQVNSGRSPFYEPGLDTYLKKVIKAKTLSASNSLEAILKSDVSIIAVGTPTNKGKIDLSFIKTASEQIGQALKKIKKYHVVVVKSTVLPGVTETVVKPILEKFSGKRVGAFGLCMNPEFLREGCAMEDALNPDRIVIGQIDEKSGREFAKIYQKYNCPKIFTNLWTAELIKYAANSLFATLISFSNEISRIAQGTNKIDIVDVWKGVHLDKRLSPMDGKSRVKPGVLSYIFSGCGFGGSCFPKDVKALSSLADEMGIDASLIKSVISINKTQPLQTIQLLRKALGKNLKGKKVTVLGLAFKPDTDDVRESASLPIIEKLISDGAKVFIHDPMAYQNGIPLQLKNLPLVLTKSVDEAVEKADGVIVVTAWSEYKELTPKFFKQKMKQPIVVDGRRIYDKISFLEAGVIYQGIGT